MVEVKLWGALSSVTDGTDRVHVDAKDIRELFRKLREAYPGMEPYLQQGVAVAIDGVLYRDNWSKRLPEEGEVFLLPRMVGG